MVIFYSYVKLPEGNGDNYYVMTVMTIITINDTVIYVRHSDTVRTNIHRLPLWSWFINPFILVLFSHYSYLHLYPSLTPAIFHNRHQLRHNRSPKRSDLRLDVASSRLLWHVLTLRPEPRPWNRGGPFWGLGESPSGVNGGSPKSSILDWDCPL